ncbi:lytic murein transglycosylase [Pseudooceanicola sp.]|uniref:lytic murein transglycosylase n=1 Tax=Pseudooceanicola sp. TaxID=1914328 RepID=UPI004058B74E|tara:strand:- start:13605 stop:14399 length:795 start_codon:yes stop_codon:yes gene_type:complete
MLRTLPALILGCLLPVAAQAAPCGNTSQGFNTWKAAFAQEAAAAGVQQRGLQALSGVQYSKGTIAADRNQKGVKYSLKDFMRIRGVDAIVAGGRKRKAGNPRFYGSLEQAYGVPSGILLAIHGMESGFGSGFGKYNVLSSNATVAYDCRRSAFFTNHLVAALKLVDRGWLDPNSRGAAHGEIGHTQFLAGNVLAYGRDGNGDGRVDLYNLGDAMASTANFLRQKGWQPGQSYDQGTRNFRVLNEWNAATVYQKAIAIAAKRIDG